MINIRADEEKVLKVVQVLVAKGEDVNFRDPASGQTPFLAAAENILPNVLKFLRKKGADWQTRDNMGRGALLSVMKTNKEKMYSWQCKILVFLSGKR